MTTIALLGEAASAEPARQSLAAPRKPLSDQASRALHKISPPPHLSIKFAKNDTEQRTTIASAIRVSASWQRIRDRGRVFVDPAVVTNSRTPGKVVPAQRAFHCLAAVVLVSPLLHPHVAHMARLCCRYRLG